MSKSVEIVSYDNSVSLGSESYERFIQDGMQTCSYALIRFGKVLTKNDGECIPKEKNSYNKVDERISWPIQATFKKLCCKEITKIEYFFMQEPKIDLMFSVFIFQRDPVSIKYSDILNFFCLLFWKTLMSIFRTGTL